MINQNGIQRCRSIKLGKFDVNTPTLWLGHDLDHQVKVWQFIQNCPGLMLNAFQIFNMPVVRARAVKESLHGLLDYCGPIFLDSGGFLFQREGKAKITTEELSLLYSQLKPDIAAILDIPLDPLESYEDEDRRWISTLKNTETMYRNTGTFLLSPVFHAYQLDVVKKRQAQLGKIIPNPPFICIGSLVPLLKASFIGARFKQGLHQTSPTLQRWHFIANLILKIRRLYPDSILHVFGVGSLSTMYLLFMLGVDSVDSMSWRLKAAYGEIQLPGLSNRTVKPRPSATRTRRPLRDKDLDLLEQCKCPICKDGTVEEKISGLSNTFVARAIHNAHVFISELESIKNAIQNGKYIEFVERRLEGFSAFEKIFDHIVLILDDELNKNLDKC